MQRSISKFASIAFSYYFHGGGGAINAGTKGTLYVSSTSPEVNVFHSFASRLSTVQFAMPGGSITETSDASIPQLTRYNISSFLDWGVIEEGKKSGVYHTSNQRRSKSPDHLAWLAEAMLISRGEAQMAFSQICHHPILFPVSVEAINASILRTNSRLKVARQGLNDDFVSLETTVAQSKQLSLSERLS